MKKLLCIVAALGVIWLFVGGPVQQFLALNFGIPSIGDPLPHLPAGCTDWGPVYVPGPIADSGTTTTGLMPASSLGEVRTVLDPQVDTSQPVLAQTLLCQGRYAVLVEDKTDNCLAPSWQYVGPFSWNDFAGEALVQWTYKCVEPGNGTFTIHLGVSVNVRRTDIPNGVVWVEYLFIIDCADPCPHTDQQFGD